MNRNVPLQRYGRMSPTSKKRVADLKLRKPIREQVFDRDGGCVLHPSRDRNPDGCMWGPCFGGLTAHHILKASQGGEYTLDNLITLCVHHNDAIEDYPIAAEACGLVRRRHVEP